MRNSFFSNRKNLNPLTVESSYLSSRIELLNEVDLSFDGGSVPPPGLPVKKLSMLDLCLTFLGFGVKLVCCFLKVDLNNVKEPSCETSCFETALREADRSRSSRESPGSI